MAFGVRTNMAVSLGGCPSLPSHVSDVKYGDYRSRFRELFCMEQRCRRLCLIARIINGQRCVVVRTAYVQTQPFRTQCKRNGWTRVHVEEEDGDKHT
jgi:hypothetical protein